jgi:molecular chaperone GrpE
VTERRPVHESTHPAAAEGTAAAEERKEEPVVRDKRRIDPTTGAVRPDAAKSPPAGHAPGAAGVPSSEDQAGARPGGQQADAGGMAAAGLADDRVAKLEQQVAERTADLQRLQAEYINYRRRVERDREAVRETAVVNVLANLLPVLDDIGRARDHGELEGGFRSVGEALEAVVEKLGLARFGTVGEPFDPMVHEALMHSYSGEVTEPTCVQVLQPGYRFGDRVVRPARVAVAEPEAIPAVPVAAADEPAAASAAAVDEASDRVGRHSSDGGSPDNSAASGNTVNDSAANRNE